MPDCVSLTETSLEQFHKFIKYLVDNNLFDDVYQHLIKFGHDKIRVSIEPVKEIQQFIADRHGGIAKAPKDAQLIITSAHSHC